MLTFVVSHNSDLVALLIAICLQIFYGTNTRILIVKLFDGDLKVSAFSPWCGVSIHLGPKDSTWSMQNHPSLLRILHPSLLFIQRLQIEATTGAAFLSPDLPIPTQHMQILAEPCHGSHKPSALFYNPTILANNLRRHLLNSSNVSFLSVTSHAALTQLIGSLRGRVFWLDFMSGFDLPRNWQTSMAIESQVNSQTARVQYTQASNAFVLPESIFWLPVFKASVGMNARQEFRCQLSLHGSVTRLDVKSSNSSFYEQEVFSKFDLIYAFDACDNVLESLDTALRVPSKL